MQNDQTNPSTNPAPQQPTFVSPKSSVVAGILGIFLGSFGAHNWYLGENKKGITHLCLFGGGFIFTIFGAILTGVTVGARVPVIGLLFGLVAMVGYIAIIGNSIWGLVEGIILLAQGDAGLAAKGYPVAVPQVYQNPTAAQPTASAAPAASEDKVAETPAEKSEKPAKTEKKSDDKKAA